VTVAPLVRGYDYTADNVAALSLADARNPHVLLPGDPDAVT
jgi:hypothetical protein